MTAATTTIFERMSALARETGAINLGQGFPDLPEPAELLGAARRALAAKSNQYPPMRGLPDLRRAVCEYYRREQDLELREEEVIVTSGATEALAAAILAFVRPGDEAVVFQPCYDAYIPLIERAGGTAVTVGLEPPRWTLPLDKLAAAIGPRTRLLILNTPNNPTGQLIALADLRRIASAAPQAVVLVDEAYIEFGGETFLPDLSRYPNVLVGRTFSKAYGLAGMRVGIVIGQPQALDPVRAVTLPFNINSVAIAATQAALRDKDFLPRYAENVAESRQRLYAACRRLGLQYWESAANFVLVRVGDPVSPYVEALAARGIHVRDRSADPHTAGCIRVTAGMLEHTDRAIEALESAVAGNERAGRSTGGVSR